MRGGLSILIFHRVLPKSDSLFPEEPDAKRFDEILSWVGGAFNVLSLEHAVSLLARGALPPRALAITFDDGYADNYAVALPILARHSMTATFFVASGFLDGGRMWNDTVIESVRAFDGSELDLSELGLGCHSTRSDQCRRATIDALLPKIKYRSLSERIDLVQAIADICRVTPPDDLMLSSTQLRALYAAGMSIGGHTCSHPILTQLEDDVARHEIAHGKAELESRLGHSISMFAYPNGKPNMDYSGKHASMVRDAGYSAAVTTAVGVARSGADVFQLPRFTPWDRSELRFGLRMVNNMRCDGELAR
jgi:peptidoglycan/xylan/chitin deacetylase (PgdA/CDA1 family)